MGTIYYVCFFLWTTFESFLLSSIIYGWPQLLEVLQDERYFVSYCENNNVTLSGESCSKRDSSLNLVYALAAFMGGVTLFSSGKFLDMYGFRKTRLLGSVVYFIAGVIMYSSTFDIQELLFLGIILTSVGGSLFSTISNKVCSIFPHRRNTAISIINGAIDTSSVILLLFKLSYNAGLSFPNIIVIYYTFSIGNVLLFTFILYPKIIPNPGETTSVPLLHENGGNVEGESDHDHQQGVPNENKCLVACSKTANIPIKREKILLENVKTNLKQEDGEHSGENEISDIIYSAENFFGTPEENRRSLEENYDVIVDLTTQRNIQHESCEDTYLFQTSENQSTLLRDGRTFLEIIKTPKYIIHATFISVHVLRLVTFVGMLNSNLKELTSDKDEVDFYLTLFGIIQACGIFISPLAGCLLDWKPAKRHRNFSTVIAFGVLGSMSILITVGILISSLEVQILCFLLYTFVKSFVYSSNTSFIMNEFPLCHAGGLVGLANFLGLVVSLVQFPFFILIEGPCKGDPTLVNLGILVVQVLVFAYPIYLWTLAQNEDANQPVTSDSLAIDCPETKC